MGQALTHRLKEAVDQPEPIDGDVVDIDTGFEETVVVTVESDGERYVEEYDLTSVTKIDSAE